MIYNLIPYHMLHIRATSYLLCLWISSCFPSTQTTKKTTSTGEELREGIGLQWSSLDAYSSVSKSTKNASTEYTQKHSTYTFCRSGYSLKHACIPTQTFSLPLQKHHLANHIIPLTPLKDKQSPFFNALISPLVLRSHISSMFRPVFALKSPESWLYLTISSHDHKQLISQGYTSLGILFYVLPGKSYGNTQLYRYRSSEHSAIPLSLQGPWYYSWNTKHHDKIFDGSLGGIDISHTQ